MSKEVIFVIDNFNGGGAERVVINLANGLYEKGYKIYALTLSSTEVEYTIPDFIEVYNISSDNPVFQTKEINDYRKHFARYKKLCKKINKVLHKPSDSGWKWSRYDFKQRYSIAIKVFAELHPDAVVISFLYSSIIATFLIAKEIPNRVIFSERSDPYYYRFSDKKTSIIHDRYYKYADCGVFQTNDAADYYKKLKNKVIILNPLKEALPFCNYGSSKTFVTLGRYHHAKNLTMMIDAFGLVVNKHPDYQLKLYGHGPEKDALGRYISSKGLEHNVFLCEFDENIHEALVNCAGYLNSSIHEGLCNAMLETMAMGLPVVCTDCPIGGAKMCIDNYSNGILVPVNDVSAFATAINYIIEEPVKAKEMGLKASEIRCKLSTEKIIEQWIEVIEGE